MTHASPSAKPFMNPYLAGFGLGLVLLITFIVMGRGLGASGAVNTAVAGAVHVAAPAHAEASPAFASYLGDGKKSPFKDWLVFQVVGVFIGGLLSGAFGNRLRVTVERGPRMSQGGRLALAFVGGAILAVGAKLALGCMSGQALTGGALLNVGSWAAMVCIFGGAYAMAWFVRRQWL